MRSIHEGARDIARDIGMTDAYVTSRRQRKKVEMLFAHLKRILKLDRLRLRGPNGAKDEFLLAATAQNLRKMADRSPRAPHTSLRIGDFFNTIRRKRPSQIPEPCLRKVTASWLGRAGG